MTFREKLWTHRPLTDFWRIGKGISQKLEAMQLFTLGDVARASLDPFSEDRLYKTFGVNAELIIDHAWGWEPVTMEDIRQYRPSTSSISSGQVLQCPYDFEKGRLIVREMTKLLVLELVRKHMVTKQIVLDIRYDHESLEGDCGKKKRQSGGNGFLWAQNSQGRSRHWKSGWLYQIHPCHHERRTRCIRSRSA